MGATNSMTQYATPDATAALAEAQHRAELAEQRLSDMKAMLADMTAQRDDVKADRNRWRTQAEATQRLLSDATARGAALVAKARRVKNEDRLSLAQMERLRAELRPNLVFVLELVRRELDELRVEHELIRRELEDIQALLHDATQRNAAGRLWWLRPNTAQTPAQARPCSSGT